MNFQQSWEYLDSLQVHKIKLGLDSMEKFLAKVGRPDRQLKCVHVAGTNGKGSVSINIVTVLAAAGYRVGLFTSPHLSSVRERFRINDAFISEEEFAHHASRVREFLGQQLITYFEFTTAVALLWFADSAVDLVVVETGLGGRLDATNIVTPLVSVITNVSMDHEAYLGDNLRSIAYEKAGIIKQGVPVVTGVAGNVALEVIFRRCLETGSEIYWYSDDFTAEQEYSSYWKWSGRSGILRGITFTGLRCGMRGNYQVANSSLALAVLVLLQKYHDVSFTGKHVREGLAAVFWPGRLEFLEVKRNGQKSPQPAKIGEGRVVKYLIDGAHNPAGVASLVETLENEYTYNKLIVVWGAMEDKDLRLTLQTICKIASALILTKPLGQRAAEPRLLRELIPHHFASNCYLRENVKDALAIAERNAGENDLVVVAGSLYLVGEVRKILVGELVDV